MGKVISRTRAGALRALGPARWPALAVAVALGSIGCRHVPVDIAAPAADRLAIPAERLARVESGRAIYTGARKCARCHSPKPISEHSAEEWKASILPRMAKKAKLSEAENRDVLEYVLAVAGGNGPS